MAEKETRDPAGRPSRAPTCNLAGATMGDRWRGQPLQRSQDEKPETAGEPTGGATRAMPGHRGIDTSVEAARALRDRLGPLQTRARAAIRDAGPAGLTADELAARLGLPRATIQPRTTELKRRGLIADSGQRRRNASGRRAIVWIAEEPGRGARPAVRTAMGRDPGPS